MCKSIGRTDMFFVWRGFLRSLLTVVSAGLGLGALSVLYTFVVRPLILQSSKPLAVNWWESISIICGVMFWLIVVLLSAHLYQKEVLIKKLLGKFCYVTFGQVFPPFFLYGIFLIFARYN